MTEQQTDRILRCIATIALAFVLTFATVVQAFAQDFEPDHRLALYISDSDPAKMRSVLNVATNVTKHYTERGELVEIRIIAFNEGLHMLRHDTSPVIERLRSFTEGMPNVHFLACGNTLDTMERQEGRVLSIFAPARMVQTGVAELIALEEAGWTLVRP